MFERQGQKKTLYPTLTAGRVHWRELNPMFLSARKALKRAIYEVFCPREGHSKGQFITFNLLNRHSRWHFITFYVVEGHSGGRFSLQFIH